MKPEEKCPMVVRNIENIKFRKDKLLHRTEPWLFLLFLFGYSK